jgi:hypothetical protein
VLATCAARNHAYPEFALYRNHARHVFWRAVEWAGRRWSRRLAGGARRRRGGLGLRSAGALGRSRFSLWWQGVAVATTDEQGEGAEDRREILRRRGVAEMGYGYMMSSTWRR